MKILPSRFVFATVLAFVFTYQWYEIFAQEILHEEQKYARGFIGYVPLSIVRPGQIRISSANVDKKVKEAIEKKYIEKVDNKYLNRAFDSDKSIIPIDDPLPTILVKIGGKDWFLLLDGHHDTAAAFKTGSKTINVKVIDDLRHLRDDVWKYLLENKLVYARNMAGETLTPLPDSFDALADDQMRYFATLIQRECQDHKTPTEKSKGPDYP
ncbi:MAG: ParB-like protein, partial [Candidatus Binatia bacterium]